MLYLITNRCFNGCSHCMNNSFPDGESASIDTTKKVLEFMSRAGCNIIVLGGGEPYEHPQFIEHMNIINESGIKIIVLCSNGNIFESDYLMNHLKKIKRLHIQISAIPEFYDNHERTKKLFYYNKKRFKKIHLIDRPIFVDSLGRAKFLKNNDYNNRKSTNCINVFLLAKQLASFKKMINVLELSGYGLCKPSVDYNGIIRAGESLECINIGSINDDNETILNNIIKKSPCMLCKDEM